MKIDLCKIFGVEEGEEFEIEKCAWAENTKYVIQNNYLYVVDSYNTKYRTCAELNDLVGGEIRKLPKKKQFTDDELCILRNIDKKFKWIARDERDKIDDYDYYVNGYDDGYEFGLMLYKDKPCKCIGWETDDDVESLNVYSNLFNSIQWEDEEPVFIDDYVERC